MDYFGARYYRAEIGIFTTIDPLMTIDENLVDPQRWNRYAYARNNPLKFIDPDGRSTVINNQGHVVSVRNDKDLGVYQQNIGYDFVGPVQPGTGVGVGETWLWDEFLEHDKSGALGRILPGARVDVGQSWDGVICVLSAQASAMNPFELVRESMPNGRFDIKKAAWADPRSGRMLEGRYASLESAGNYLAGLNAANRWPFRTEIMGMAGGLHRMGGMTGVVLGGLGLVAPTERYMGEIPYAGFYIDKGIARATRR